MLTKKTIVLGTLALSLFVTCAAWAGNKKNNVDTGRQGTRRTSNCRVGVRTENQVD